MANAGGVAEQFFAAWTDRNFERARGLLHDDVSFEGPLDTFTDADAYLQALRGLSEIVTGADVRRVFAEGDEACVLYDLHTAPVPDSPVAEWYRVRDGRIAAIRAYFDARPFAALFAEGSAPPH
jgi:ketosteroid isomerase-like protein